MRAVPKIIKERNRRRKVASPTFQKFCTTVLEDASGAPEFSSRSPLRHVQKDARAQTLNIALGGPRKSRAFPLISAITKPEEILRAPRLLHPFVLMQRCHVRLLTGAATSPANALPRSLPTFRSLLPPSRFHAPPSSGPFCVWKSAKMHPYKTHLYASGGAFYGFS